MKKEYNFSKGNQGKFFRQDANLNLPIDSEPLYRDGRHYDRTNESYRDDIPF